ncbi:MAG: exodeoxyribonuclease VII large subunit [Anaerolineae bacterium]|nr:exodeoxyribonuclease VII large subunit [Anaerolineae bacterium]
MDAPTRWTVGEITRYVRKLFELDYRLQELEVEGEISDLRIPGSGHAYFTLKDVDAQLRCVMWRSAVQAQSRMPEHGEKVIARGRVGVYEASGQYQLYCDQLYPAGQGDLHARFEALKAKLEAEGLFEQERKRAISELPHVIGVVTSPSTAALQDVLNVLKRRYPLARVVLSPTPVQGDAAPPQIVAALEAINTQTDVDVVLLVRGGGSLEDLWCFNDEQVARAAAASRIPVISGVGHEIDFTLADFAADLRAPTPSVAAELATPITVDDLTAIVLEKRRLLGEYLSVAVSENRRRLDQLAYTLHYLSPGGKIDSARQSIDQLSERASSAMHRLLELQRAKLDGIRRALDAISPLSTLSRGYAIVSDQSGRVIGGAEGIQPGDLINVRLHRGRLTAEVIKQEIEDE